MFNYEKRDFQHLENGREYIFTHVPAPDGTDCIRSTSGPVEMGINIKVFADEKRNTYPTSEPKIILHEVKVGDFIGEYDKSEKRLRLRSFKICEINEDGVIALGADEIFIFPNDKK